MRSGRAPPAHGRIGLEQSRQGRLGAGRHSLGTSLSTGAPVRRGGGQAINVAGQRWQGAGALGRRERCQRRRSQRIELRRQGEDGVDDGGVRVRHAAAEGGQDCSRASGACAETRRLRAGEIEAAGGAIVLGPQRRLVERGQSLSAVRAAVEQAGSRDVRRRSSSPCAIPSGNRVARLRPDSAAAYSDRPAADGPPMRPVHTIRKFAIQPVNLAGPGAASFCEHHSPRSGREDPQQNT